MCKISDLVVINNEKLCGREWVSLLENHNFEDETLTMYGNDEACFHDCDRLEIYDGYQCTVIKEHLYMPIGLFLCSLYVLKLFISKLVYW